jgi:tetratricopeptide (TPR) repeat protein
MHSANLLWARQAARFLRVLACALVLPLFSAFAQDSSSDTLVFRGDRPQISLTVRNSAGEVITTAGTAKLLHDGILADQAGLSHGRAFFGPLSFGDYTLVVEASGYKSTEKDLNLSVAMRYEVDANLQRDSVDNAGAAASPKPLLAPKAKEALDKALKALSANKLSEAEKHLNESAKLAPGHPDVLYVQGVVFLKQQNWVQAQSALEKASQMDPTNARAFSALGMALEDEGKHDQAIAPLEKSLQLDAGAWEPQWVLGEAYYHLQQYDQALKASQLAWTQSNGKAPQVELLLAKALTAVGKYEDAAQSLRDFLKRYGDRPEAPNARRWLDGLAKNGKIRSN